MQQQAPQRDEAGLGGVPGRRRKRGGGAGSRPGVGGASRREDMDDRRRRAVGRIIQGFPSRRHPTQYNRGVKLNPDARFPTLCIHAGQEPDPATGAIITPIYQTSTYVQEALGRHKGYEYARTQNPTRAALEANVAALEGGAQGFAFASGMAAIGAVATLLQAGDHAVVADNTYGGTFRLFEQGAAAPGHRRSPTSTPATSTPSRAASSRRRGCSSLETPTNPMMTLTDLAAAGRLAHAAASWSPSTTRSRARRCSGRSRSAPTSSLHSTTKYLNGHSDSIGGIVVATRDDHASGCSSTRTPTARS